MVGEDRYCIDILQQISAAQAALIEAGRVLLAGYVKDGLAEAMKSREPRDRQKRIDELAEAVSRFGRFGPSRDDINDDAAGQLPVRERKR
jgi:DNA-binding FrmR family transcriptional regulator